MTRPNSLCRLDFMWVGAQGFTFSSWRVFPPWPCIVLCFDLFCGPWVPSPCKRTSHTKPSGDSGSTGAPRQFSLAPTLPQVELLNIHTGTKVKTPKSSCCHVSLSPSCGVLSPARVQSGAQEPTEPRATGIVQGTSLLPAPFVHRLPDPIEQGRGWFRVSSLRSFQAQQLPRS